MASTLKQYWLDESARIDAERAAHLIVATALRAQTLAAQASQRSDADALAAAATAVDAARAALAKIVMPADGDPAIAALEAALEALNAARVTLARDELGVQALRAELAREEATLAALVGQLGSAQTTAKTEDAALQARQAVADRLTIGDLASLAGDAAAALAASAATAAARVESELPASGTPAKSLLGRVRARRALIEGSAHAAASVQALAFAAANTLLAKAQADFDAAVAAVQALAVAGPRLAADAAALAALAALPAPVPPNYPILTRWEHDLLFDATLQAAREAALANLTAVDDAQGAVRSAQTAYDTALLAAMKAAPDATQAELDAGAANAERGTLDAKLALRVTARGGVSGADAAALAAWFAAVPDKLWDALDLLDGASVRLTALVGPPTPANLVAAMGAAETALATALTAARSAEARAVGAQRALARACGIALAERETRAQRERAYVRAGAMF